MIRKMPRGEAEAEARLVGAIDAFGKIQDYISTFRERIDDIEKSLSRDSNIHAEVLSAEIRTLLNNIKEEMEKNIYTKDGRLWIMHEAITQYSHLRADVGIIKHEVVSLRTKFNRVIWIGFGIIFVIDIFLRLTQFDDAIRKWFPWL